jgi:acyl-coenzyme A synthetase/AMP-(fatty) acid ligase
MNIVAGEYDQHIVPARIDPLFFDIERFGKAPAIIEECGKIWSYHDLITLADDLIAPLSDRRRLIAIECSNTIRCIAAYVGTMRKGHVALLIKPDSINENCKVISKFMPQDVFHTSSRKSNFVNLNTNHVSLHHDLSVLLTTSGSTGNPKAVRLSRSNLISNSESISKYLKLYDGDRAITTLAFYYSYGLSIINSHLLHGHSIILSDQALSSDQFWTTFHQLGATSFAGVPYSFELLERSGFLDRPLPDTLRYFTQAGGKLAPDKIVRFAKHAEQAGARFYVMYGQTEAAPRMAYLPPHLVADRPDSIGIAIPGGELKISDEVGNRISQAGIEGELVYSGPNIMMGYASSSSELAGGPELTELRTGDLAVQGADGMFAITGRKSRFVKPFGLRIGLDDVEARLHQQGWIAAAVGDDTAIKIWVEGDVEPGIVAKYVSDQFGLTHEAVIANNIDALPRLSSGKIDYAAVQNLGGGGEIDDQQTGFASIGEEISDLLGYPVSAETSFAAAGGDSLNFVRATIILEDRLGYLPSGWEAMTMRQLSDLPLKVVTAPSVPNLSFLDKARAGLMLLGVPYHAAMAYSSIPAIVNSRDTSVILTAFQSLSHTFRMPAFFLISGYFAMMIVINRNPGQWFRQRAVRLGIPLLTVIFLINPILMFGRAVGRNDGVGNAINDWLGQLKTPGQHWIEHGWFLLFLIVFSLMLATVSGNIRIFLKKPIVRRYVEAILIEPMAFVAGALLIGICVGVCVGLTVALRVNFILWDMVSISSMVSLAPLFAVGCIISIDREYLYKFSNINVITTISAVISILVLSVIQFQEGAVFRALTFVMIPAVGLLSSRVILAGARKYLKYNGNVSDFLVDASMTVFLVHQIFVVFLVDMFLSVNFPSIYEWLIITFFATAASLLFYKMTSRSALVSLLLNGVARRRSGTMAHIASGTAS